MSITVDAGQYVVELPDQGIRQAFNPDTRAPFANEAEAQAWQDATLAAIADHQAAAAAEATAAEQARLAAEIHLEITASSTTVVVGAAVQITATLKNGLGATVPLDQTFAVPIQDDFGTVVRVKSVTLVGGAATVSMTFDKSGYYRITEAGINAKLEGMRIGLPAPFEVTVFE